MSSQTCENEYSVLMGAVPGGQIKGAAKGAVSALSTAITVRLSLTLISSGNCIIYIFIYFISRIILSGVHPLRKTQTQ